MNALTVTDLCKTYIVSKKQNHVLRNISFTIPEGELTAIMGPSGSGKSTLLYTVSGMDNMTAGQVTFFEKKLDQLSSNQLSNVRLDEMGFIFQQMHMLKNLSIYDNIILPAWESENGKSRSQRAAIKERARSLMFKLGIADIETNDIHEVSGGQLQRACICRSIINRPKMIFADEPTGSLNQQTSKEVMKELIRINQEGTTIMLVTHDLKIAAKSDRILYIEDGSIQGELSLGKYKEEDLGKDREKKASDWLMSMGW